MTKTLNKNLAAVLAVVVALLLSFVAVAATTQMAQADIITLKDSTGADAKFSDAVTKLDVAKLDPDTREYVKGAKLQIIEKDTNKVVDEWTTDGSIHSNSKQLNVNTHYILRETTTPNGYETAKDTEFYIDETEGVGVHIVSGDSAELTQSYTINLYDKKKSTTNETTVTKTTNNTKTNTTSSSKSKLTQTGDMVMWVAGGVALVCVIAGCVLVVARKKSAKDDDAPSGL